MFFEYNPAKRVKGQTGYLEAGQECCGLEDQPSKDFSKVRNKSFNFGRW